MQGRRASFEHLPQPPVIDQGLLRDDTRLLAKRPHFRDSDDASMDNNTNFNWKMKKQGAFTTLGGGLYQVDPGKGPISVLGCNQMQIEAHEFYETSNFFIDTLQGEFCKPVGDDWMEFKDPVIEEDILDLPSVHETQSKDETGKTGTDDEPIAEESQPQLNTGKWTDDEHFLFLQALKIHGKDWELIEQHIGTRDAKAIRSHAQKFLARLVKFLNDEPVIEEIGQEEAQFFVGILSKKYHKSTKLRLQREKEYLDKLAKTKIFEVTKVKREPPLYQQILKDQDLVMNDGPKKAADTKSAVSSRSNPRMIQPATNFQKRFNQADTVLRGKISKFEQWRETTSLASGKPQPISFSIKVRQNNDNSFRQHSTIKPPQKDCRFSFKSVFKYGLESDDEGVSQTSLYHLRYGIDDYFPTEKLSFLEGRITNEVIAQFSDKLVGMMGNLEDMDIPEDEDPLLILQIGEDGPQFDFMEQITHHTFVAEFYFMRRYRIQDKMPNLYKLTMKKFGAMMDEIDPNQSYQDMGMPPMILCIFESVMGGSFQNIFDQEISFFFADRETFKPRPYVPSPEFSMLIQEEMKKMNQPQSEGEQQQGFNFGQIFNNFDNPFSQGHALQDQEIENEEPPEMEEHRLPSFGPGAPSDFNPAQFLASQAPSASQVVSHSSALPTGALDKEKNPQIIQNYTINIYNFSGEKQAEQVPSCTGSTQEPTRLPGAPGSQVPPAGQQSQPQMMRSQQKKQPSSTYTSPSKRPGAGFNPRLSCLSEKKHS